MDTITYTQHREKTKFRGKFFIQFLFYRPLSCFSCRASEETIASRGRIKECSGKSGGFTLVEVVVTIGVLIVFTGILLVGVAEARKKAAVRGAAQQFAGHLREVASLAKNGVRDSACEEGIGEGDVRECARYHVSWDADSGAYEIFTSFGTTKWVKSSYNLPGGVVFSARGELEFISDFPILEVRNAGSIELKRDSLHRVCVEVSGVGIVDVESGSCSGSSSSPPAVTHILIP